MEKQSDCSPASGCCQPQPATVSIGTIDRAASHDQHRIDVRDAYATVARASSAGSSCGEAAGCCGVSDDSAINTLISTRLGYSEEELTQVPEGADMGLGCGNPGAIAALKPGETVVDLGAGGGFDCFLASPRVGSSGRVIGIDMTPEMVSKARSNAIRGRFDNVEFRLGEIEHLPVADASVDVILSNCVINLSPDKGQVLREALRVLRPGGRLAISDVVAIREMPREMREDRDLIAGCIGNAALIDDLEQMLTKAGFSAIRIVTKPESSDFIRDWAPGRGVEEYVVSATIEAIRPIGQ